MHTVGRREEGGKGGEEGGNGESYTHKYTHTHTHTHTQQQPRAVSTYTWYSGNCLYFSNSASHSA